MKTLVLLLACGVYEITQTHQISPSSWVRTTVKAESIAQALEKQAKYPFYRITKVEEVKPSRGKRAARGRKSL